MTQPTDPSARTPRAKVGGCLGSGVTLAVAICLGVILAGLFGWAIERLCKRWTGESAIEAFSFLPPGW